MSGFVVFDIGGVLVPEGTRMSRLQNFTESLTGPYDRQAFTENYWKLRPEYDLGARDRDFWLPVLSSAGVTEQTALAHVTDIATYDAHLNSEVPADQQGLLTELTNAGLTLAILSNAPRGMALAVKERPWFTAFTVAVFSSEHNVMKPDAQIYQLLDDALGVSARDHSRIVFFDDREQNVRAGQAHGWHAQIWNGVESARDHLTSVGILSSEGRP